METQKSNAKTPDPSENGDKIKKTSMNENNEVDSNIPEKLPIPDRETLNSNEAIQSDDHQKEDTVKVDNTEKLPDKGGEVVQESHEKQLSPILEVSGRFMANLRKISWKGLAGGRKSLIGPEPVGEKGKMPVSRRLRDWDTRLFVISTLKKLVEHEHFEELEEEDSRTQFTRDTFQNRKRMTEGSDQRQRRRKKDEMLLTTSRLTKMTTEEDVRLNTRDKQRAKKLRQLQDKDRTAKAGKALTDALQKVIVIKDPHPVIESPDKIIEHRNDDVINQENEIQEHDSEKKEQIQQKRGFFNLGIKL